MGPPTQIGAPIRIAYLIVQHNCDIGTTHRLCCCSWIYKDLVHFEKTIWSTKHTSQSTGLSNVSPIQDQRIKTHLGKVQKSKNHLGQVQKSTPLKRRLAKRKTLHRIQNAASLSNNHNIITLCHYNTTNVNTKIKTNQNVVVYSSFLPLFSKSESIPKNNWENSLHLSPPVSETNRRLKVSNPPLQEKKPIDSFPLTQLSDREFLSPLNQSKPHKFPTTFHSFPTKVTMTNDTWILYQPYAQHAPRYHTNDNFTRRNCTNPT